MLVRVGQVARVGSDKNVDDARFMATHFLDAYEYLTTLTAFKKQKKANMGKDCAIDDLEQKENLGATNAKP